MEFNGELVEYEDGDYKAAVEFTLYEDKKTAVVHLTLHKSTPSVLKTVSGDFSDLLALCVSLGVERVTAIAPEDNDKILGFQERFGFKPYKVHRHTDKNYIVSMYEGYNDLCEVITDGA